ncbi:hypothetical protein D9M71_404180 [compost metagenome]
MQVARREVRGEGVGQAHLRRQLGAEQAGAEQPDRHVAVHAGHGNHRLPRLARAEQRLQLGDILGEVVGAAAALAAQGARGLRVGTRRAAEAQLDAPRIERGERAELLGHHQRRMVGQHDPAGTQAQGRGAGGQIAEQHGGGRTGDALHVVVLGHPEAREAEPLGVLRQRQRTPQRRPRPGVVVAQRGQVEDGKRGGGQLAHTASGKSHHGFMGAGEGKARLGTSGADQGGASSVG